jgi:3-hydroxyisobutyrate dehydrogenase
MGKALVGFVGLGIMGRPMALNLAKAGFRLIVHNRTGAKAEAIASPTIEVAGSPAEVARHSEIVIVIVKDSKAVEEVIAGDQGLLAGVRPGAVIVDMSTISPTVEREMARLLAEKSAHLVDAPVSGGDIGAQQGTLAIMVGGEKEIYERLLPVFQAMGRTITHCGPVGHGQLAKLCNQILVALNLLGVSEALAFARRSGLDTSVMIEAVKGGAAGSWQLSHLGPRIVARDFGPGFMVDLMQKDLKLVLGSADESLTSLPATALVHQLFNAVQNRGWGSEGTQALAKILEELSSLSDSQDWGEL